MENNLHNFTGISEFCKERRSPGNSWGTLSMRVLMNQNSFHFNGQEVIIPSPTIWVSVKVDYESQKLKKNCQYVFDQASAKKYIFIVGSKITDYEIQAKDELNRVIPSAPVETRFNIEVSASGCFFSEKPFATINNSILVGKVESITQNNQLVMSMPYMAKQTLKFRKAIVWYEGEFKPELLHKRIYVSGQVFGKTPSSADKIYVVAKQLEVIRA